MELILFVGLQGSGKSTFYKKMFIDTHLRLNMDMLRTRHREQLLLRACIEAKQPVVIDNTNPTVEERARYIRPARAAGFGVAGYYFHSSVQDCKERNARRRPEEVVPLPGLLGTLKRIERPALIEGFDRLWYVRIGAGGAFVVENWKEESPGEVR